jgi:hypothetical protein
MMDAIGVGLFGSIGTLAFFGFFAFAIWLDYRKKAEETQTAHAERMKAIEMGFSPLDAEIQRAKAYASAAWAAGLVGLLVPITIVSLTLIGTIVALNRRAPGEDLTAPVVVAWSIAGVVVLVTIVMSLNVIRHLPRPTAEAQPRPTDTERRGESSTTDFQRKPLEL